MGLQPGLFAGDHLGLANRWLVQQIPKRFPSGSTCWRRMMKCSGEGVFETVLELLSNGPRRTIQP